MSIVAASNNDPPPDGFPENMAYGSVNDAARELMAALARWRDAAFGAAATTGGTQPAYTVTTGQSFAAYEAGQRISFTVHSAPTGNVTLAVDGLAARNLVDATGAQIGSGGLALNGKYEAVVRTADIQLLTAQRTVSPASETVAGVVELATTAEAVTGTDTARAVTPAGLAASAARRANNLSDLASAATAFGNIKQAASDTATGVVEIADAAEMVTGTDVARAVTPGRMQFHRGFPKVWAHIVLSVGTPSLVGAHNVTSITDNGVGDISVTIGTDFAGTSYAAVFGILETTALSAISLVTRAAGSFRMEAVRVDTFANIDPGEYSVACFGDV